MKIEIRLGRKVPEPKRMKRQPMPFSKPDRDVQRNAYHGHLVRVICLLIACGAIVSLSTSCTSNRVEAVSTQSQPITSLYYLPKDLMTSEEFKRVVGTPPTDPAQLEKDREAVQQAQEDAPAGSQQRARAQDQERLKVMVCNGTLGPWFRVESFPATSNLLQKAFDDSWVVAHKAKDLHYRRRPDGTTQTSSYPSGHATEGSVLAGLLKSLDPKHAAEADKLEQEICRNRLILKKHYPTDLQAGNRLGAWLLKDMAPSEAFKRDFAAASRELKPSLEKSP